jgi:dephospho-CoA kinase
MTTSSKQSEFDVARNTASNKIIGIGGLSRSGKDSLAELFMANGFFGVSFGDIIRRHTRERHADKPDPISVANMTETANWLREREGADVVLREALELYKQEQAAGKDYKGLVLFSVRAPIEADFILEHGGELIWVEASDEVRYRRMIDHMREGEARISMKEFIRQENLQAEPQPGVPVEAQMNASYIKQKATVIFENNEDSLEAFHQKAAQLVGKFTA